MTPRDRVWSAIRSFGTHNHFSAAEIIVLTRRMVDGEPEYLDSKTVFPYLNGLKNAKPPFIEHGPAQRPFHRPIRECQLFYLVRDVGVQAPHVRENGQPATENIAQQQMWNAMRIYKGTFDWRDIVQTCPANPPEKTVKNYLLMLGRAGYLAEVKKGAGGRPSIFKFVQARDTGPRPPMITAKKEVMDANTGQIVLQAQKKGAAHAE
jgi:hypothetical protein